MTNKADAWVVDYDAARAQAIRWLGDRYLLAKPINRSPQGWRGAAAVTETPVRPTPSERCRDMAEGVGHRGPAPHR
jgi:hypothetical protein